MLAFWHRRLPRAGRRRVARRRRPAGAQARRADRLAARVRRASPCSAPCPGSVCASSLRASSSACVAARALWRSRRRTLAIGSVEVSLFSVALAVGHQRGALRRPAPPTRPPTPPPARLGLADDLGRLPRVATLFADPGFGLLRWAPLFVLAFVGSLVAVALAPRAPRPRGPGLHAIELTAGLCAAALARPARRAVLLAPTADTVPFAGPPPDPGAAACRPAGGARPAPPAPRGRRAGGAQRRRSRPGSTPTRAGAAARWRSGGLPPALERPTNTLGLSA